MTRRWLGALAACLGLLAAAGAAAGPASRGPSSRQAWSRDLSGYWTNATYVPLERPAEFAGRPLLTEDEAIRFQRQKELQENSQPKDDIHYDNVLWQSERYRKGTVDRRTSIVDDPADGRIPPLTAAATRRQAEQAEAARRRGPADAAEYRSLGERCISWGNEGPPMLGSTYSAHMQILQTSTEVVIRHELMHGVRVIPVDGTPHVGAHLRLLHGDSRGRWEGDTLVVETTNFTDRTPFRGPPATARQDIFSSDRLRVVERFTRVDADTIRYRFTVDDPGTWVRPWSGEMIMRRWDGPIYEYACHEGNYGLGFILSAARAAERRN